MDVGDSGDEDAEGRGGRPRDKVASSSGGSSGGSGGGSGGGGGSTSSDAAFGATAAASGVDYSEPAIVIPGSDLGPLHSLEVAVDVEPHERVDGWFLDRAEVTQARSGEHWLFPCARWFGEAAGPDSPARVWQRLRPREESAALQRRRRKARPPTAPALRLHAGAAAVPHPNKVRSGVKSHVRREEGHAGEDAYFVLRGGQHALGVADGVYLWRDQGIDAGEFAREIMGAAKSAAAALDDPLEVLRVARQAVRDRTGVRGSCTACVVSLDCRTGVLRSANVGDSGYAVFRLNTQRSSPTRAAFHTPQQEHSFGCPYQLGHHDGASEPEEAQVATVSVDEGDVVVAGSDGLWDNLFNSEIAEHLRPLFDLDPATAARPAHAEAAAAECARALVAAAMHASNDRRRETPYSRGASEEFDMIYSGGKRDDITVVVARVSAAELSGDSLS